MLDRFSRLAVELASVMPFRVPVLIRMVTRPLVKASAQWIGVGQIADSNCQLYDFNQARATIFQKPSKVTEEPKVISATLIDQSQRSISSLPRRRDGNKFTLPRTNMSKVRAPTAAKMNVNQALAQTLQVASIYT